MRKKFYFILSLLVIYVSPLFANDYKIQAQFDYAVFKGAENKSILEIYYSVLQKTLSYKMNSQNNNFEAVASLNIYIKENTTNEIKYNEVYSLPSSISDTNQANLNLNLVGQINLILNPGNYTLSIVVNDMNNTVNFDSVSMEIDVKNFGSSLNLSDIELSTAISKSQDKNSIFHKNTLEVIPNAGALYGNNLNNLYYYAESYGLKSVNSPNLKLTETITDENNNTVYTNVKEIKVSGDSRVEYGKINIDNLASKSYLLTLTIADSVKNISVTRSKKFWVYNPKIDAPVTDSPDKEFLVSEYAAMREELVNLDFDLTFFLRTDNEKKAFESLPGLNEKRKFMFEFWKRRDPNQNTLQNEFKQEYLKKILEANQLFKEPFKEGWKTDRGRIYVTYGKPEEIESFPYSNDKKSYEIWKYEKLEGGAICAFMEITQSGSGIYELVHSTIRTELRNDDWENKLYQ
ncbi:MAG TPA: GWxTD domain-containing protein [Ignavibacteria bacterium]|nr:GWxTD domain-containing protein [Ignavibacteria bacterium]